MLLCLAYPPCLADEKMRQRVVWYDYFMEGGVCGRGWILDPNSHLLVYSSVVLTFWNSGHIYLSLPSTFPLHALPNTANLYLTLEFVRFTCSFEFHGDCLSLAQTPSPPHVLFIDQKLYCGLFYDSFFLVFHPISTRFNNLPPACSQN